MSSNDLHVRLAATILRQLETADPASWSLPWHGADPMPRNARTGRCYRGINVVSLWSAAQAHDYTDARWATYRQWAALGAQVRGSERGTLVLYYKELPRSARQDARAGNDAEATDSAPFVARVAHVFNAAQVDAAQPLSGTGLPGAVLDLPPAFEAFVAATGATIRHGGARACYVPASDTIHLPARTAFHTLTGYAGTLAHELVHWTGAPHRLARDLTGRYGVRTYAAEELVAELGAAFVLADLGIARTPHPDHAAYCASWAPLMRADPRALSHAAVQASRAADYLTTLPFDPDQAAPEMASTLMIAAPASWATA